MRGTTNSKAFRAYLKGEKLFSAVSERQMAQCRACFERATQLDKGFARAWGWRSYAAVRSVLQGWLPDTALKDAEKWAKKSVRLDSYDYAPLWDLAFVYLNTGRYREAIATYEKAHRLYNDATDRLDRKPGLLAEMAEAYVHVGKPAQGIRLLQRAMRVPDWYRWNLGWAYFNARDYARALEELLQINLNPRNPQYVPEVRLFIAAAAFRQSQRLSRRRRSNEARTLKRRADGEVRAFLRGHPDYTLANAVQGRSRFRDEKDLEHWVGALKAVGLRPPGGTRGGPRPGRRRKRPGPRKGAGK